MKKNISFILAILMSLSLAACANPQPGEESNSSYAPGNNSLVAVPGTTDETADETNPGTTGETVRDTTPETVPETTAETVDTQNAELDEQYDAAMMLYNTGEYLEAATAFYVLNGYKDSAEMNKKCYEAILERQYQSAMALFNDEKYPEAAELFRYLSEYRGYKDSAEMVEKCGAAMIDKDYREAKALYDNGQYTESLTKLMALGGYKDSAELMENCQAFIKAGQYQTAKELFENGRYEEAADLLKELDGYEDSTEMMESCIAILTKPLSGVLRNIEAGDTFLFGSYEQDNNKANGEEGIEWVVLAKEDNRVLVISKYVLDVVEYQNSYVNTTWETSSLRTWLNDTFLNTAFNAAVQGRILSTEVTADKNPSTNADPGNKTNDKVFLLSINEVKEYFPTNESRMCVPTAYAEKYGAHTYLSEMASVGSGKDKQLDGRPTCWWWLRTPGTSSGDAAIVTLTGSVRSAGRTVTDCECGVRPAMWIGIE